MNILSILMRNIANGPSTEAFPFGPATTPERYRGRVIFDADSCQGCRVCERVCPGGALKFTRTPEGLAVAIWHNTCSFCGMCEFYCPTTSIQLTNDWHLAHRQEEKFTLVERGLIPNQECADCGAKCLATAPTVDTVKPPLSPEDFKALQKLCPRCRAKSLAARKAQS